MRGTYYRGEGKRELIRNNDGNLKWSVAVWLAEIDTNTKKHSNSGEASGYSENQDFSYSLRRSKIQSIPTAQHSTAPVVTTHSWTDPVCILHLILVFHLAVSPKPAVPFRGRKTM
jgi:hypothetical protein